MHKSLAYLIELSAVLDHGNLDVLIAEHYLRLMNWKRARQMLESGIRRGRLRDALHAERLLKRTLLEIEHARLKQQCDMAKTESL